MGHSDCLTFKRDRKDILRKHAPDILKQANRTDLTIETVIINIERLKHLAQKYKIEIVPSSKYLTYPTFATPMLLQGKTRGFTYHSEFDGKRLTASAFIHPWFACHEIAHRPIAQLFDKHRAELHNYGNPGFWEEDLVHTLSFMWLKGAGYHPNFILPRNPNDRKYWDALQGYLYGFDEYTQPF